MPPKKYKSKKQLKKEGLMGKDSYIAPSFKKATPSMQIKQIIPLFQKSLSAATRKTTGSILPTQMLKANQPELVFGGKIPTQNVYKTHKFGKKKGQIKRYKFGALKGLGKMTGK